jgi:hypothetical protein
MSADAGDLPSTNGGDVLASLPRHRPGRRASRRDAATGAKDINGGPPEVTRAAASKGDATSGPRDTSGAASRAKGSSRRKTGTARRAKSAPKVRATSSSGRGGARKAAGIPEQGFEIEEDVRVGRAVDPPSRLELATSLIEIVGEGVEDLVRSGVSAGGSLLKRTLELIPRP